MSSRYDYIDVQELLAAREESRRKVQENQLRRRSIISNFSRRWTRKTINTNPGNTNSRRQRTTLLTHRVTGNSNLNNDFADLKCSISNHHDNTTRNQVPVPVMEHPNPEKISLTLSVDENNFGAKIQSASSATCTSTTPTTTVMKDSVSSTTILPRDSSQYSIQNNNGRYIGFFRQIISQRARKFKKVQTKKNP